MTIQATETHTEAAPRLAPQSPLWSEVGTIVSRCQQLRPNSPVRRIAECLLDPSPCAPTAEEAEDLIAMLAHPHWQPLWSRANRRWLMKWQSAQPDYAERTVAAWSLGVLDLPAALREEAVAGLLKTVSLRQRLDLRMAWRDCVRGVLWASLSALSLVTLFMILIILLTGADILYGALVISAFLATPLAPLLASVSFVYSGDDNSFLRELALRALVSCPNAKAIDIVARACFNQEKVLRRAALLTIDGVLPCLTAQDYGRLTTKTVPRLCLILKEGMRNYLSPSVQMRILDALAKVGDGRALPTLTQITRDNRTPLPIREAAAQTYALIEERMQQETERAVLLRGSSGEQSDAVTVLLRAAAETQTPAEQLLRPTQIPRG